MHVTVWMALFAWASLIGVSLLYIRAAEALTRHVDQHHAAEWTRDLPWSARGAGRERFYRDNIVFRLVVGARDVPTPDPVLSGLETKAARLALLWVIVLVFCLLLTARIPAELLPEWIQNYRPSGRFG